MKKTTKNIVAITTVLTTTSIIGAPMVQNISKVNSILLVNQDQNSTSAGQLIVNNSNKDKLFSLGIKNDALEITKGSSVITGNQDNSFTIYVTNSNRSILNYVSVNGGENPSNSVYNTLNAMKISNGDYITISGQTGSTYELNNITQASSATYEVVNGKLVSITNQVNSLSAKYNNGKVIVSANLNPNTKTIVLCNNIEYNTVSNAEGNINLTIDGTVGKTVTVIPQGEQQSSTIVQATTKTNPIIKENPSPVTKKISTKIPIIKPITKETNQKSTIKTESSTPKMNLTNSSATINNVWNQPIFTLGFNENNSLKINAGWGETNPYYSGSTAMNVQLISNKGNIIKSVNYPAGKQIGNEIAKDFSNIQIQSGDLIHIMSNSGASVSIDGKSYKNNVYMSITPNGLKEVNLTNNSILANYTGTATVVTGKTLPNTDIEVNCNGSIYKTTSTADGEFTCNIPAVLPGTVIYVMDGNNSAQPVKVTYNSNDFQISNSKIQVINNWGSDAVNIGFNPATMTLTTSGYNEYLGSSTSGDAVGMYLYHNGELIKGALFNGDNNTSTFGNTFNNISFNFGDIIALCCNTNMSNIKVLNNKTSIGNNNGTMEYFKITPSGLVPYTPKLTINPLNIITSTPTKSFTVSGTTAPNNPVKVTYDGETYSGLSSSNGNYNIYISSNDILNTTTPITVWAKDEISKTTFASPANNLQSDSGVYLASKWAYFGNITFNPVTMKMEWLDADSSVNPQANNPTTYKPNVTPSNLNTVIDKGLSSKAFGITIKNSKGQTVLSGSVTGNDTLQSVYNLINGKSFSYGDTVTLYQNQAAVAFNVFSNGKVITPNQQTVSFKITATGLVDADAGQSVYSSAFNLGSYYSGSGVVATGQTASGYDDSGNGLASSMVMNQAMKTAVDNAIKNCTTPYEKAEAIFNLVSPIPYVSAGGNAINTWEHGGVCFNKAILYTTMCRYAGIVSRVVTGYANEPSKYQRYTGYHSWNQIWAPSKNQWITVDTTWHMFNCGTYVDNTRHSFSVQITAWNPEKSYTSYFESDPAMAWQNACTVWNHQLYYDFNYSNDPQFQALFKGIEPSNITITNYWGLSAANITLNDTTNTLSVSGNPKSWLGENSNKYLTIEFINPTTGQVLFNCSLNGNNTVAELQKELDNQKYSIGDLIKISYDNSQGKVGVNVGSKSIIDSTGVYQITNTGLKDYTKTIA